MSNQTTNKEIRWERLNAYRAKPESVERNVIRGCSIVTTGEALGHGVHIDEDFVMEVYRQASDMRIGLKSRFGHPGMCSEALGTYLGRFRNFSLVDGGKRLKADLHFAESARKTPHGDLAEYVKQLAEDDPKAFGTSIVFKPGTPYRRDKDGNKVMPDKWEEYDEFELTGEIFASCEELLDCDFVDEPAANPDGLFSSASVAGEINKFMAENPEVKKFLKNNENVVDYIEKYGVHVRQYLEEMNMSEPENETVEHDSKETEATTEVVEETFAETETEQVESSEAETEEAEEGETVSECEQEAMSGEAQSMSLTEYRQIVTECGVEIADEVLSENGKYADAVAKHNEKLRKENEELKAKIAKYESELDETGTKFRAAEDDKPNLTGRERSLAFFRNQNKG